MTINIITGMDRFQWILKNCKLSDRIVDIGGNDGHTFVNTPFRPYVTTVDIDKYDIPNFYQMDAHDLKFPDKFFDTSILAEILEHVEDPVQVIKEAKRVSKRILMTIPNEYEWDQSIFPFETIETGMKRKNQTLEQMAREGNPAVKEFYTKDNYKHLFHNRYYTEDMLRADLEKAGITDYKLEKLQYGSPQWSFFVVDIDTTKQQERIFGWNEDGVTGTVINTQSKASTTDIKIDIPKGPIITCGNYGNYSNYGKEVDTKSVPHSKDKLRIALVSTPFFGVPPSKYGGLEQVLWDLAEGLDELGHIVTIFCPEGSSIPKHGSLISTGPAIDTVGVDWFKEEENRYFKWKDIINSDRFDIVHDHSWFAFPYLHKMNNLRLKVIHTHHGGYTWDTAPPFPKPNLVAISKFMRDYTIQYFKQKGFSIQSEYVYNGVNLDRYNFNPRINKTDRLLYLGRFSAFKQPDMAIRVAKRANLPIDLIGGTFIDNQDYLRQIDAMCDGKDVVMYKDASHEFKIKKLQEARVLIVPSKMSEPFGLTCIEGMACGTPIICTRDGAIPEIVLDRETGFICDTEDQMVEAVNKIYEINPANCRKRAEEFSRLKMAENYVKLYQKMMKGEDW